MSMLHVYKIKRILLELNWDTHCLWKNLEFFVRTHTENILTLVCASSTFEFYVFVVTSKDKYVK